MAEIDHLALYRKYRVLSKNDNDIFNIRYVLADDSKPPRKKQQESSQKSGRQFSQDRQVELKKDVSNEKKNFQQKNKAIDHLMQGNIKTKIHKKQNKKQYQQKISPQEKIQQKQVTKQIQKVEQQQVFEVKKIKQEQVNKVNKANEGYHLIQKLSVDGDSDNDEILDELQPLPLINKKSKSSDFKELFPQMELARKSQLFIKDPRKLFDEYLDIQTIQQSRDNREGIYFRGIVQFSDTVKWYCNIMSNELEGVLIVEGRNTNRALHQDQVYFKLLSEEKEKILCGVVAIAKRELKEIVGKIEFNKSKQSYFLKPTNAKLAAMDINLTDINKQWLQNVYTKYFLAKFAYWQSTDDHPHCQIISQYGNFGQVEIQTLALLKNYGIEDKKYSQKQIQDFISSIKGSINEAGQFVPPQEQIKKRKDFRKWRTFIIKDCQFDTAFSISPLNVRGKADPNFLKKNIYEINVHFIDVSYFIRENSVLDDEAKKKLASYNLVYKYLSLLPQQIQSLYTFRHKKDILTISVGFQVDEEGNVLDTSKLAKSIINPQFTFSHDQLFKMTTKQVPFEEWKSWNCGCQMQSQFKLILNDVKLINKLIMKRRQNRIKSGALIFQIPIKSFQFDPNIRPTHFQLKNKNNVSYMIEECVISASTKVAQFLFKNLKGKAILYRHKFPGLKRLNKFKDSLKKMGQSLPSNSKEIQAYINEIVMNGQIKQCIKDAIKYQTIKLLQNFDYFLVQGTDPSTWVHYAINTPIYTHCSTPKRHYGDLMVQRQMSSVLDGVGWKVEESQMKQLIELSNKSKLYYQNIRIGCEKIFLCLYLRDNPIFTNAVLTSIEEWGIKLCIPKFNQKTMIKFKHLKSITVTKFSTDQSGRKSVKLDYFNQSQDFKTKIVLKEMQEVNIQIKSANTYPLNYAFSIVLPHPTNPNLKISIE